MFHITLSEHELATAVQVRELKTHMEKLMSQLDDLQATETAIKGDLDQIKTFLSAQADRLQALQDQLTQLQQTTPPQVDLQPAIELAATIRAEADEIVASFSPAPPADPTLVVTDDSVGGSSTDASEPSETGENVVDGTGDVSDSDITTTDQPQ